MEIIIAFITHTGYEHENCLMSVKVASKKLVTAKAVCRL